MRTNPEYTVIGNTYNVNVFYKEHGIDGCWVKDGYEYEVQLIKGGEIISEWNSLFETAYPDQPLTRRQARNAINQIKREIHHQGVGVREWFTF